MKDLNPPPAATRAPRTFEMQDSEWVESGRPGARRALRVPLWLVVPAAVLAAMTAAFFVIFAVLAALFTGGLLAARRRFLDGAATLRERVSGAFRRRG
jgi:hypothetical protein